MSGNPSETFPKNSEMIFLGDCQFDVNIATLLFSDGRRVPLRNQSAKVLAELVKASGEIVSKDVLITAVWGETFVTDDSLVQCIKDIRKVLGDKDHKIVRTIPKMGYRLMVTVASKPEHISKPSIFIEKVHVTGNSAEASLLAEEFYDNLCLLLSRRTGVRFFTDENALEAMDYIVRCRTTVSGGRAKLFISLSETKLRGNFYSHKFECDFHDIEPFSVSAAKEISSILRICIIGHEGLKYIDVPNDQLDIEQLLSKALWFYNRITSKDTEAGRVTMQVAFDKAPHNPKVLAMLAHSTTQMYPLVINDLSEGQIKHSISLADRAVTIGPSSALAFRTRGNLRLWLLGDHQGCKADCRRALEINSNFYLPHLTLATSELLSGNYIEGEKRIKSFVRLTSIDRQYPLYLSLIALARFLNGDEEKAMEVAKEAYERVPTIPWYALVYAATAGNFKSVVETNQFRQMISELELPKSHFRKLPFAIEGDIAKLERNLSCAGVSD